MKFIDSHAHLYAEDFEDDLDEVVYRAKISGVERVLLPNIDADSIASLKKTYTTYSDFMYPMMGLHPTSVDGTYKRQLEIIRSELYSMDYPYIAVGEIGLDFYWDTTFKEEQLISLKTQLDWALECKLPVVIHSRDAYKELYDILIEEKYAELTGVIHSFTGSVEELELFLPLENWYIGINGIVTFKNSDLWKVVEKTPLKRLLIETDAPYLAPVPKRGRRNESEFLVYTLARCAEIYQIPIEELACLTKENTELLFRL